jgi:hypothetical protein
MQKTTIVDGRSGMSIKKLLAATTLGAVAGMALLVAPAAATPTAASSCDDYYLTTSHTFRPGYEAYPWAYFLSSPTGETFYICVDVPDSAEVQVDLRELRDVGGQAVYVTVASAPAGRGDKKFSYHTGIYSAYHVRITTTQDSGTYTAGLTYGSIG